MTAPRVAVPHTEDHGIASRHVGRELRLWIARPVGGWRGLPPEPPRVLWVLDGDLFFGTAVETTRLMHQLFGELPPLLVVGVAYGTDDPRAQAELRARDLTPSVDAGLAAQGAALAADREPLLPEGRRMGGAAEFLAFLVEEARPYVAERFEVAPGDDVLFGSSLGGLFATWAFLTAPGAFHDTIAVSPALWWDDEAVFDLEARTARERRDVEARMVLAAGSLEEPPGVPFLERFRLVGNTRRMAERLARRAWPSLRVEHRVLEGETHTSVVAPALSRGLRLLLGPPAGGPPGARPSEQPAAGAPVARPPESPP